MDYEITYRLPSGNWYTKHCENGGDYIRKLLKRGIQAFSVRIWTCANPIYLDRSVRDGEPELTVSMVYGYYRTRMGDVYEYRTNGRNLINLKDCTIVRSC